MILSVLLHKVFWLNFFGDTVSETFRVEQGTLTLVGTSCETVCMPSWPMEPTAMRPRTQTFAYTNWFASQAKPRKWNDTVLYRVHFMKGSCFNSMSRQDMFSTVRPFCLAFVCSCNYPGFCLGCLELKPPQTSPSNNRKKLFAHVTTKRQLCKHILLKSQQQIGDSQVQVASWSIILKLAVNPGEPGHQEVGPGPIGLGQTSPGLCSAGPDWGTLEGMQPTIVIWSNSEFAEAILSNCVCQFVDLKIEGLLIMAVFSA